MEKTTTKISDYLNSLPAESQADMKLLDAEISKALPKATKVMWEGIFWGGTEQRIIGYGDMTFKNSRGKEVEWFSIGLALQKNYITVFLSAVDAKGYVAENHKGKLGKAKVGKSAINFAKVADVDLPKLIEVVKYAYKILSERS